MKFPRDLSGNDFARLLRKFGYEVTRQTGSHMRLTSKMMGHEHHITIPAHKSLRVGTLAQILASVAEYLQTSREELARQLFS